MKISEYLDKFAEIRKTLRQDIKDILQKHDRMSLNFHDIKTTLQVLDIVDDEELLNEFDDFRQSNVMNVYYTDGMTLECYVDYIAVSADNEVTFSATDCFCDREIDVQTAYDTMDLYCLYALLVDFFGRFNYDAKTNQITLKD